MKSKVGELDGRPLIMTQYPDEVRGSELLVYYNDNKDKITDIQKREGEELISILDIDDSVEGDASDFHPDVIIQYCAGTTGNYNTNIETIYYSLDSGVILERVLDGTGFILDYGDMSQYPNRTIIQLNQDDYGCYVTLRITGVNPNNMVKILDYIVKIKSRIDPSAIKEYRIVEGEGYVVAEFITESLTINLCKD